MDYLAILQAQVEQNLRERQAGRERQDAGERVSGSRKEVAALRKLALNPGELMKAEASPAAAQQMVRKNQVFPRPDFEGWRAAGSMSPSAAGFMFAVWKTFPDQPKSNSPFARMAYVRLASDLNTWVNVYSSSKLLASTTAAHCERALLGAVFGFDAWYLRDIGNKLDDYNFYVSDLTAEQRLTIHRLLVAVRRFTPADEIMRWAEETGIAPDFSADKEDLLRLLYNFPEVDYLAAQEPLPHDLFRTATDAQDEYEQLQPWREFSRLVSESERSMKWLTIARHAHDQERQVTDFDQERAMSVYLPRVLALHYGTAFAGLLFTGTDYALPPAGAKPWRYNSRTDKRQDQRNVLMRPGVGLNSPAALKEWNYVCLLLGLQQEGVAEKPAAPKKPEEPQERVPLSHIRRKGGILVTDVQVHEQFLLTTFGFRAVEYGNYVHDKEGTEHLRHFVSALTDLCDTLNLDPKKINHAGGLAIAFGSRGHGGKAMATYHPTHRLINLTKSNGDGTVAHEWLHYLDHLLFVHLATTINAFKPYASRLVSDTFENRYAELLVGKSKKVYVSAKPRQASSTVQAKRAQEATANRAEVDEARKQITWGGWPNKSHDHAKAMKLLNRVWQAIRNGYYFDDDKVLVASNPAAEVRDVTAYVGEKSRSSYRLKLPAYPVVAVFEAKKGYISPTIKDMLARTRNGLITVPDMLGLLFTGRSGYASYFGLGPEEDAERADGADLFRAIAFDLDLPSITVTLSKTLVSTFYQISAAHKNADYWASPWELFARSFEKFVHDEMALRGQANNYLVDGDKFSRYGGMYPAGAEALLVNGAWRQFFAFLSQDAALGPFSAPWCDGERVDEYIAFGKKNGESGVTEGVISDASETAGVPAAAAPTAPAGPDRARALLLAKAKVIVLALAKAKARARAAQ